jgi:hypothetical protein
MTGTHVQTGPERAYRHFQPVTHGRPPVVQDLSLQARYRTVWPVLVTRFWWEGCAGAMRVCTLGQARWLRTTTAILLGGMSAATQ